jgi:hypothetical protein
MINTYYELQMLRFTKIEIKSNRFRFKTIHYF